jgi:hypothetical protein
MYTGFHTRPYRLYLPLNVRDWLISKGDENIRQRLLEWRESDKTTLDGKESNLRYLESRSPYSLAMTKDLMDWLILKGNANVKEWLFEWYNEENSTEDYWDEPVVIEPLDAFWDKDYRIAS